MTTRGMKELIAEYVDVVVKHHTDENYLQKIRKDVAQLCEQFPAYR